MIVQYLSFIYLSSLFTDLKTIRLRIFFFFTIPRLCAHIPVWALKGINAGLNEVHLLIVKKVNL